MPRSPWLHIAALWVVTGCGHFRVETVPLDGDVEDTPDGSLMDAPDSGLVAWYPMESDPAMQGSPDVTGRGNDARCAGAGCPVRVAGFVGSAIQLDGIDDRLVVPDSPQLHLTGGFTATLWMQWLGGDAAVLAKPQATGAGAAFEISVLLDKVVACTDDQLGVDGESCFGRPGALPQATWIALALTWDGRLRTFYVDGVQIASSEHGAAFDGSPLLIGGDDHDGTQRSAHHGLIDEVKIYGRALSPQEISALRAIDIARRDPGQP